MRYIYDIIFGMLQVRKNEISLRKWSGATAQQRTLVGPLMRGHSTVNAFGKGEDLILH